LKAGQTSIDWADDERDTVVFDPSKALTVRWKAPPRLALVAKTPPSGGVLPVPPRPMMKRLPTGTFRPIPKRPL